MRFDFIVSRCLAHFQDLVALAEAVLPAFYYTDITKAKGWNTKFQTTRLPCCWWLGLFIGDGRLNSHLKTVFEIF